MSEPTNQPFFTIAIPTYNRARLLDRCLRAALDQTFADCEILVADNCSTDDTPDVVARYRDPRIRYVRHAANIGPIANFRYLTDQARGRFFVLNQDDDLIHRDYLRRCHAAVTSEEGIVAYACSLWRGHDQHGFTSMIAADPDANWSELIIQDKPHVMPGADLVVSLLYIFYYVHPALAYRTDVFREVGGIPLDVVGTVDIIAESRVFSRGKVAIDPWAGVVYSQHGENISHKMTRAQKRQCRIDLYHEIIALLESQNYDWRQRLHRLLSHMNDEQLGWVMREWIRNDAPPALQQELREAIRRRCPDAAGRLRLMVRRVGWHKTARFAMRLLKGGAQARRRKADGQ